MSSTRSALPAGGLELVTGIGPLRAAISKLRQQGKSIGLVPTMGALHAGHLSLIDASRNRCDVTVATIYVNPTQFSAHEDLGRYPRSLDADVEALGRRGVDLCFAPADDEVYRPGHATFVDVGPLADLCEGQFRLGHFRGVATIVLKLLHLVPADVAFFGRKDYQQWLVVCQMVRDFDMDVQVEACPIVREPDGLAMSSRNAYLSEDERCRARSLSESLERAARLVAAGERDADTIRQAVVDHVQRVGRVEPQYVAVVREGTMTSVDTIDGPTVLALAAQFGTTRLIDNRLVV
ncbi:MAG: pantoate--beta-alanine ligase [Pirellulales bacterium]